MQKPISKVLGELGKPVGGVLWLDKPIQKSDLDENSYFRLFQKYSTILVESSSDTILAAGTDIHRLEDAALSRGFSSSSMRLEPGPGYLADHINERS